MSWEHAPRSDEFAVSASGVAEIARLIGMPSKQSIIGERWVFPAGMRNSATSVIQSSLGAPALKWCFPRPSRSRLPGASEISPW